MRRFGVLTFVALCASVAAHADDDDRLLLSAPNSLGHQGLVRTTSALIGDTGTMALGLSGRAGLADDFVLDGADGAVFFDGNAAASIGLFKVIELALQSHAGSVLSTQRATPQSSVGDLRLALKGGASFGMFAAAASAHLSLPTRANRAGFALDNLGTGGAAHLTADLLELGIPVRAHLNGGYTFQTGKLAGDAALLTGGDGALIAVAAQQWFFDQVHAGLGVEVPLPYVTPFVEVWYQTAIGAPGDYGFFGDAWLIATPGVRAGVGGLRVDLGVDIGLSGNDVTRVIDGQPHNPLFALRIGIAHAFDFTDTSPRPRITEPEDTTTPKVTVPEPPATGRLQGFVTTKDDEAIDATIWLTDKNGRRELGKATGGTFEAQVAAGRVSVTATAPGYLAHGVRLVVDADGRRTVTLVMRKEPKKRSVTLGADKLELGARIPFVFKGQRLQSTAGYLLDEIADVLHQNPNVRVSIEVHTDPSEAEDPSAAKALTEGRALVVKDALADVGIDESRLEASGYGITQLVGPPADPKNRRVELLVIK